MRSSLVFRNGDRPEAGLTAGEDERVARAILRTSDSGRSNHLS